MPADSIAIQENPQAEILQEDSLLQAAADSLQVVDTDPAGSFGIILQRPSYPQLQKYEPQSNGMSWLLFGVLVLFVVICFRYHKNSRYFHGLFDEMMEVRVRHNIFDETVRENFFMLLLNVLWCLCGGILLYEFIAPREAVADLGSMVSGMLVCAGVAVGYTLFMTVAYFIVGNVFSDSGRTSLWLKGFFSSQGLTSVVLFPIAMLALVIPGYGTGLLIVAIIAFIATKIIFIYKGFRIFFTQTASWVLFLYYLCSLEIVPLILAYAAAYSLCAHL